MPTEAYKEYSNDQLIPYFAPERAVPRSIRFQASQSILKGQPIGYATSAVNAVQTISITGSPTGGTFKLKFGGQTTASLNHNSSAAAIKTALEALASIGSGNVDTSGGALPGTPVVVTFIGNLAGRPVSLITVVNEALTGGSSPAVSIANTTVGVVKGGAKAWEGELVSAPGVPTVSAQAGGSVFGDGSGDFAYAVTVTFYNDSGETVESKAAQVIVSGTDQTIRVNAYASVDSNISGARYYINGRYAGTTAVASGDIAQTDITDWATGGNVPPSENGCFKSVDGSHIVRGFARTDIATDVNGAVTFGTSSDGMDHGEKRNESAIFITGFFRIGDLVLTSANRDQLTRFGRMVTGDVSDSNGVFELAGK